MQNKKMSKLLTIFTTFFKIGLFTFGGGFAMIPLLEKEIVENQGWIEKERFIDAISLTQSVPGAIAINLSIFFGYNIAGGIGAFTAAVAVSLPSFLIILSIAFYFNTFNNIAIINSIFMGIRPAVVGLIIYAGFNLSKSIKWNYSLLVTFVSVLIGGLVLNLNPVIIIISVIIAGSLVYFLKKKKVLKKSTNKSMTIKKLLQKL
ncbi:MAG: chromate transporter [Halanaerobiaceae bacterium]